MESFLGIATYRVELELDAKRGVEGGVAERDLLRVGLEAL